MDTPPHTINQEKILTDNNPKLPYYIGTFVHFSSGQVLLVFRLSRAVGSFFKRLYFVLQFPVSVKPSAGLSATSGKLGTTSGQPRDNLKATLGQPRGKLGKISVNFVIICKAYGSERLFSLVLQHFLFPEKLMNYYCVLSKSV